MAVIIEDLPAIASESFKLALAGCGDCRDYHATFAYVRAAGFRRGASDLRAMAERISSQGSALRVLIVGSADTGQVAALANSLVGSDFRLTLIDICDTPLKVCAAFAARHGIPLEVRKRDVRNVGGLGPFDAILLHNFINFIPTDKRVTVLSGLRKTLSDHGRVWLFQRVYDQREQNAKVPRPNIEDILDAMQAQSIAFPEGRADFFRRLQAEFASSARDNRLSAFKTSGDVESLLRQAGFSRVLRLP